MKNISLTFFLFLLLGALKAQNNVGIGTGTPNPKSVLELSATDKGFLVPRVTTAQRLAIAPAGAADQALLVYDTDDQLFYFWNAAAWIPFPLPGGNNTAFAFDPATGDLSITDPGGTLTVNIPPSGDNDPTNELVTNLVYNSSNQTLTLTEAGNNFTVTLAAPGVTGPADAAAFCAGITSGPLPIMGNPNTLCNSVVFQSGTNIGINTTSPAVSLHINSTNAVAIPTGTTAQQPAGAPVGSMRFNTNLGAVEVFNGTCWQLVNTPPLGSTYIQWSAAADPNTLYPCTQWVRTDMNNGEFIRAAGGASNTPAAGPLSGVVQPHAVQDHTHASSGSVGNSAVLTTSSDGTHSHGGFTGGYNDIGTGCGNPKYVPYDDNTAAATISSTSNAVSLSCPWNGNATVGNFLGRLNVELNHNHAITADGAHTHTVPAHNHPLTLNVGNMNSGNTGTETRPVNVAVFFWRRVL